jgi:hypothetical protein
MNKDKVDFIVPYFDKWRSDVKRAETLIESEEYFTEGILALSCYIGALARLRYPSEEKDWKSYKRLVAEYSGLSDIYGNIDLLFFAQWPRSRFAQKSIYCKMNNHAELCSLFRERFGDNHVIKESKDRYKKRADLVGIIRDANSSWFDENNFIEYVELFSNNQILYQFLRCDAVHNNEFPLFNSSYNPETKKIRYIDNHQITRVVLVETVKNIIGNLEAECVANGKWPCEL